MTEKKAQIGYKEAKRVIESLGFVSKMSVGSHHHFKHPKNGTKVTLPFYKKPYSDFFIDECGTTSGIRKEEIFGIGDRQASSQTISQKPSNR